MPESDVPRVYSLFLQEQIEGLWSIDLPGHVTTHKAQRRIQDHHLTLAGLVQLTKP